MTAATAQSARKANRKRMGPSLRHWSRSIKGAKLIAMKHALAIVGLLLTAAPASAQGVLDQVPVETIMIRVSYRAIADCAFGRLDQVSGAGVLLSVHWEAP